MADGKPNRHRGEIAADLDGRQWNLCLTLGALAELETHFGVADLGDLAGKLGSGRLSAGQMTAILAAGLRGGGHDVSDAEAARMRCGDGIAGMARIVADLVAVTFGAGGEATKVSGQPPNPTPPREGG